MLAAGAVVLQDVSAYSVVGGVPAQILRARFEPETAMRLRAIQWSHWSDEVSAELSHDFNDVALLLAKYSPC